ncbi:MAG TPA: DUF305 domain-containing protein [Hyphomicrobium sp.]|nr:DUF305 domain-containing protein [Hyphomicrobium sp.]
MSFKLWKIAIAALAVASVAAMPGFTSAAVAMGCGCCKGKEASSKSKAAGGCMGGAEKGGRKGGMSCMKGMDMADMSVQQQASDDAMMSDMDHSKMDMSGVDTTSSDGNPDVAFAKAMIPHHEAALVMAKNLLKTGRNDEMKAMAKEIIAAQSKEIKTLYGWLAKNAE